MAADQQFCLRWNNHQSTLISVFDTLLESETLVDCTLAAEGQYLKAHKVVLSACSPYLEVLLSQHYEKHPIVILKDVKFQELKSMMDYMYRGEVNISQDQLGTFLKAAESLQIKGLSDGGGGENDSRDVGSTQTTPKRHDLPRKVPPSVPPVPQPRNPLLPHSQSNSGLSIEPRRPVPQHISDSAPESPSHRSREGSISPSLRKRRRTRRPSQGDDSNLDSHIDTSNSCDVPNQAQSTPLSTGIVPSIPASMTPLVPSSTITKPPPIETEQNLQTDTLNRLDNSNSLPPESGLIKEKIEPTNEGLLEPKTEYMDDLNNEDSVEDLTLDDDDEMDGMDMARPGPSHGGDGSNQGFGSWHMTGNQSGTDEVFMAAQEAVGAAHRDSQGKKTLEMQDEEDDFSELEEYDFDEVEEGSVQEIKMVDIQNIEENDIRKAENGSDQEIEDGCGKGIQNGGIKGNEEGSIATRTRKFKKMRMPVRFENFYTNEIPKVMCNQKKTILGSKIKNKSLIVKRGRKKGMMKRLLNKSDEEVNGVNPFMKKIKTCEFCCNNCGALYQHKASLVRHQKFECGIEPQFSCALCDYRGKHKGSLKKHIINIHLPINWDVEVAKGTPLIQKERKRPGRKPLNLNKTI